MTLSRRDFLLGATAVAATIAVPVVVRAEPKIIRSHYLTDPDAWYLVESKHPVARAMQRTKQRVGADVYNNAFDDWRCIVASPT